ADRRARERAERKAAAERRKQPHAEEPEAESEVTGEIAVLPPRRASPTTVTLPARRPRADAVPRKHRPPTRAARARWLPSERVVGIMLVLVAVGAGYVLLYGLVKIAVAP
ncbi:MAG TPA: hypothetical protein VFZ89_10455, partial [Solirubrobacteraceae bacterium]